MQLEKFRALILMEMRFISKKQKIHLMCFGLTKERRGSSSDAGAISLSVSLQSCSSWSSTFTRLSSLTNNTLALEATHLGPTVQQCIPPMVSNEWSTWRQLIINTSSILQAGSLTWTTRSRFKEVLPASVKIDGNLVFRPTITTTWSGMVMNLRLIKYVKTRWSTLIRLASLLCLPIWLLSL